MLLLCPLATDPTTLSLHHSHLFQPSLQLVDLVLQLHQQVQVLEAQMLAAAFLLLAH
jgi:hypothetical protein